MNLPTLTYLAMDSVEEGVGASQILPYVERLAARGVDVVLHTFEKTSPSGSISARLRRAGVRWVPHPFGDFGSVGGMARVVRGSVAIRGAELVHARSDLSAASAMLAGVPVWVWDMRSFWVDQRIELGTLRRGSVQERILRLVERKAAERSAAIVTLAGSAVAVLEQRWGTQVGRKSRVIPTCVDLDRFRVSPMPVGVPLRFMLSGTLNAYYDVPTMLRLVDRMDVGRPKELVVFSPLPTFWDSYFDRAGVERMSSPPEAMPRQTAAAHVGLSVCRFDAGVSLTAAMPTKVAEFLACGRPVVVNAGLGDMDEIIAGYRCGVVLPDPTAPSLDRAIEQLQTLVADPETPARCRAAAENYFDLDQAVTDLIALYRNSCQATF